MRVLVQKFGGSSLGSVDAVGRALGVIRGADLPVLVVCSASGDTTDLLLECARAAEQGNATRTESVLGEIREHHRQLSSGLQDADSDEARTRIRELLDGLESLLRGVLLVRESSPRTTDAILSFGEQLSSTIVAAALGGGELAALRDARSFLRTNAEFGNAAVDMETTRRLAAEALLPPLARGTQVGAENAGARDAGVLAVTQGFVGATAGGVTTTLGRGGSDYSAAIVAASCAAERLEIWTDVSGIMTCDPRLVPQARSVSRLNYEEAAELAFFGARVLHPATVQPALEADIPVLVRNTMAPDAPGTRIDSGSDEAGVRAIAFRGGNRVITVQSSRAAATHGMLHRIFAAFDRYRISVDLLATSETSVSATSAAAAIPEGLLAELGAIGSVTVESGQSIVSLVGQGLWNDPGLVARAFSSVEPDPLRLISLGASDTNLSFVLPDERAPEVVKRLHRAFFET